MKKIDALLARAGDDDRIRGAFRYHGAATGRWAGQGYQPQNLKRLTVKDEELDAAIAAVATGDYEHVRARYERPLAIVGECSRPTICSASGHVLIGGDFSAVELRVLAWTADEEWKLESYRRFDETHDPRDEPYCITACKIFRVPDGSFTKELPERGVGKTCDLAFGYMGALGAWRKFEPEKFTDEEVEKFKAEWRAAHPKIVELWHALDRAAWTAVRERGRVVRCGCVAFKCTGAFLQLKLPSGRKISYPNPRIKVNQSARTGRRLQRQRRWSVYGLPARSRRIRRHVDRERRERDQSRPARRSDAADRGSWISDRAALSRRDRRRGTGRLSQY